MRPTTAENSPSAPSQEEFERLLWYDVCAEYDARFYSAFLRTLDVRLSDDFWKVEGKWAADEERHFQALRGAYHEHFGWGAAQDARLAERRPDFGPFEHLFDDEFSILCLGAYDELVTVRGYRANFEVYGLLSPELEKLMRRITADEGLHFTAFLDQLRQRHEHRFPEASAVLERIRAAEGLPYAATFVFDHDDPIYEDGIFDEALELLARRLRTTRAPLRASGN